MEYQVLKPGDPNYPQRLLDRLGEEAPRQLYDHGPLSDLRRFILAVISADSISGEAMMAANQLLFTFLSDRFCPPLHEFPEREEYFRRAQNGELLMLSVVDPQISRTARKNVLTRNWIACALSDAVFVPFATKGTKTDAMTQKIIQAKIPIFTTNHESNSDLHELGISTFDRKTVEKYFDSLGAVKSKTEVAKPPTIILPDNRPPVTEQLKAPEQLPLWTKGKQGR